MSKEQAGTITLLAILFTGLASLNVYANSPAPVHYREYFSNTIMMLILAALFTSFIEIAVAAWMKVMDKRLVFLTNILTNLAMNIGLGYLDFTFRLYLNGYYFIVLCIFETLVLVTEYRVYCIFMRGTTPKKSILEYVVTANAASFFLGILVLHGLGLDVL